MTQKQHFKGFTQETIRFFRNVRKNNNKPWFEANRKTYENHVLNPLRNLVTDLGLFMQMLDPQFDIRPQVNRTVARIYRDVRFSHDKTLFRDHLWITFRRHQGRLSDEVSYYFEIREDTFSCGMGFYSAPRETMINLRKRMLANSQKFLRTANNPILHENFTLSGPCYKRPPVKDYPGELDKWMKFKSFHYEKTQPNDPLVFSAALVDELKEGFLILYPMYCFIQNMQPKVRVNF